ncbi:MAG TPA: BrnT family toxin [Steroidobacteraceae bacterium]|nr:BrnT family toxin [Steroidobacteraceae bacterium]
MEYEWDPAKAKANVRKHRISFADAALALEDPRALTVADPDAGGEHRFVSLGSDPNGRVLVTVFTSRGSRTRIISSRKASPNERRIYESK